MGHFHKLLCEEMIFPLLKGKMEKKGMTFDHDFCNYTLLFSSLLKKEGRENENEVAKIVMKSHTFLFHPREKMIIFSRGQ